MASVKSSSASYHLIMKKYVQNIYAINPKKHLEFTYL